MIIRQLEEGSLSETQAKETKDMFNSVVDWCVVNWNMLASSVAEEKAVLDICKEIQKMKEVSSA
jgi:hypothetical protein